MLLFFLQNMQILKFLLQNLLKNVKKSGTNKILGFYASIIILSPSYQLFLK